MYIYMYVHRTRDMLSSQRFGMLSSTPRGHRENTGGCRVSFLDGCHKLSWGKKGGIQPVFLKVCHCV